MLDNKKDAVKFINKTLKTKLNECDIEKYNSSFVSKIFQNKEEDIVYKFRDNNIFFLIEHQTKIDYSMPYRILEYEMEIMKSTMDMQKIKNKSYKIPLVIPIVLYTGRREWNAEQNLENMQEKLEGFDMKMSNYNLVDINNYTEEELLKEDTLISKVMLLEKAKNTEETVNFLEKIIPKIKENDKEVMERIISIILSVRLGDEETKKIVKKLEGEDEKMLAVMEMLEKENQMYINIGKKEGKLNEKIEIVNNMLKEKFSVEMICKITGMKKIEVEKLKNQNYKN